MRNIEALRNYFLGKDPQLKETMADNSLRLCGIQGKYYVLRKELVDRLTELKKYVDDSDKDLQDALDELEHTVDEEIERLETKWDITEDVRIYNLDNGVYRVLTPEIKLYYKQNSDFINDDDLVLVKEDRAFFAFSRVPGQDHPTIAYGIADANDGWYQTLRMEDIESVTNKKDTITQSSTHYPSTLAVYNALLGYYTKAEVDHLIDVIPKFDIEIVNALPTQDISETTIYLLPSSDPDTGNAYEEYIYVDNDWELIGTTNIDLSNYYTKSQVDAKTFTTTLTADVHVPDNAKVTGLTQGWYFTGTHKVYFGNSVDASVYENALFYFYDDGEDQWFDFLPPNLDNGWFQLQTYIWYDTVNNIWEYGGYDIRDSLVSISDQSTDSTIPTSKSVYMAIENNGEGVKEITASSISIWDLDPRFI